MAVLQGIDVSAIGQGEAFDWPAWSDKISFAFAKATEGTSFHDPAYTFNDRGMRSLGVVPGAYHVLHGGDDGAAQARFFLSVASSAPGTLLMVDYEPTTTDGRSAAEMSDIGAAFADVVHAETGAWPLAYGDISMVVGGWLNGLRACPLYLANPSRVPTRAPIGPWNLVSFEQTGQKGVDTDVFYGDLNQLRRLGTVHYASSAAPPAPAPPATIEGWRLVIRAGVPSFVAIKSADNGATWR